MSTQFDLEFTQMLCSRVCHDLVSPVGAVNSGLELLEESALPENREVIDLISQSAVVASKRLVLFRFAFGYGANVSCLNDLQEIIEKSIDTTKFKIQWSFPDNLLAGHSDVKTWARLIVNIIIVAMEAAPYGGNIRIFLPAGNMIQLSVSLDAATITLPDEVSTAIQSRVQSSHLTPRNVQAVLLAILAESLNRQVSITKVSTNGLSFTTKEMQANLQKINV